MFSTTRLVSSCSRRTFLSCKRYNATSSKQTKPTKQPSKPTPVYSKPTDTNDRLYALALETLAKHRAEKLKLAETLQKEADELLKNDSSQTAKNLAKAIGFRREKALIEADINEPLVQQNFKSGNFDLRSPVYRHLAENAFKERLSKTMEHLEFFKIMDEYLPVSAFSMINSDVQLEFAALTQRSVEEPIPAKTNKNPYLIRQFTKIISTELLLDAPQLRVTPFVRDDKMYTIMMVDIDHPDLKSGNITERCHWLVSDIPINVYTCQNKTITANDGTTVIPYLPPHPARGTKPHRYIFLLLEQSGEIGKKILQCGEPAKTQMNSTDERAIHSSKLIKGNKLIIRGVAGIRCEWDENVTKVYEEILGHEYEPVFGKAPEVKSYIQADGRRRPKYLNM